MSRLFQNNGYNGGNALLQCPAPVTNIGEELFLLGHHGGKLRVILAAIRFCVKTQISTGFQNPCRR
jgi:hypothetical protein